MRYESRSVGLITKPIPRLTRDDLIPNVIYHHVHHIASVVIVGFDIDPLILTAWENDQPSPQRTF